MTGLSTYYQPIFYFIRQQVSNPIDAEDLTQDVFYKFIRSMEKTVVTNTKSCLYTIAKNIVIDYYRSKKAPLEALEKDVLIDDVHLDDLSLSNEEHLKLKTYLLAIIDELPVKYQQIIKLSELEGVSQKDIAEELGLNYATVRSRIQRGRQKLKKAISDCCEIIQGGQGSIIGYRPTESCTCDCTIGEIHYLS